MLKQTDWELKSRTFARRFPLFMTSFFCYAHMHHFVIDDLFCPNLLLATEICPKNEKNWGFIWAKPRKCHICNLFSSRVFKYYTNVAFTGFALNLLLSIYIFATYFRRANFIITCANTFSFSAKTAIIARWFEQLSQFMNYFYNSF